MHAVLDFIISRIFFNAVILIADNEDLCQQTNIIAVYYADHILLNDVRRGETSFKKQPLLSNAESNLQNFHSI